ncbi:vascular cell adhesion protein 1-like [Sebastes fasciatus]|uniref:vascular cell adhesion protein 1-like n=1 Tax=Sebastes fasciatus TaxID=394691 RepID=UPI003D9EF6D1
MLTDSMLRLRMLGLLVLVFSLCDADSICPTELNPLFLDPPEVLGEYNESVELNCSSIEEDHDGMYWRVGNTDSAVELDYSRTVYEVSLSDWNVTAECRIKMNATHECSKDLEITVYQNPEMVTVYPTKYADALEGTWYQLQCDVINVAPVQNLTVKWYRDNDYIRTDTFTKKTKRLVSESSTLTVNLTRGDNGVQFRCEAQLDFGPDGPLLPVVSDNHTVSVHYAPEFMNETEDVYVNEGDSVTLNCEAEARPPPKFHWIDLHGGMNVTKTNYLNITGVVTDTTWNCTAINYLGNITKQIHVHVIKPITPAAAPAAITTPSAIPTPGPTTPRGCPLVLTPAEVVVEFGGPASVNCSTSAADVSKMGWEAKVGGISTEDSSVVTWKVERVEDWDTKPLCFINWGDDDTQCQVELDISFYQTPDNVSVSALEQGPMVEGTEHWLLCDITDVAPLKNLKLTWYRGNEILHTEMFNGTSTTPVNVNGTLRVIPERDHNGALFRCKAELLLGPNGPELVPTVTSPPYVAVVHYKPLIKDCPDHFAGVEGEFSLDMWRCKADGNPPPTVQWYYEENLINASEPLTRAKSGKYTAEIGNSLGNTSISVLITIEYEPSFTCDARLEVVENGALPCEPDGIPTPVITWFKDGKEMASPPRWTKDDSGKYSLKATNEHGIATHALNVDVLYAPVFTHVTYKNEVNPGDNVTFACIAKGNPPPEVKWHYDSSAVNVRVTTGGSQQSISVTGATSTNAGVYRCDATNKVGSVTTSVTLIMKDPKPRAARFSVIWWLLILLAIVLIVILILIIVVRRWKKHGRYRFVPDRPNDGSDIPMSPQSNGVQA